MIECLRLIGYERFGLAMIDEIEINFTEVIQIILGRNGSGKSSLMAELSPLPGEHTNFRQGGEKYVRIAYKGQRYELTSSFPRGKGHTGHHSFIDLATGEEWNKGKTLAIQKELVLATFGVNKERMEILLGKERFSAMSPKKRQDWLTLLSPVSLDYAFDVYGTVKGLKRDVDGVVRHHQERLSKESANAPNDGEQQAVKRGLDDAMAHVEALMQVQYGLPKASGNIQSLTSITDALQGALRDAKKTLRDYPRFHRSLDVRDREAFQDLIHARELEIAKLDAAIDHWSQEYTRLQDHQPTADVSLSEEKIVALRDEVATLTQRCQDAQAACVVPTIFPGVEAVELGDRFNLQDTLDTVEQELIGLMQALPDNREKTLSRERFEEAKSTLAQIHRTERHHEQRRDAILARLQQLKTCQSVTCPTCTHTFRPGVDEEEPTRLEKELTQLVATLERCEEQGPKCQAYIDRVEAYQQQLHQYRQLCQSYPWLQPLWDALAQDNVMTTYPHGYLSGVHDVFHYLRARATLHALMARYHVAANQLRYIDAIDPQAKEEVEKHLKRLEEKVSHYTGQRKRVAQHRDQLVQYRTQMDTLIERADRAQQQITTSLTQLEARCHQDLRETVERELRDVHLQVAELRRQLHDIDVRRGVLTDLEGQLTLSRQHQDDWKVVIKALCPKEGLLGRYLKGFMEHVVAFMNAVIDRVWTYSLEVHPSKIEKETLDYRFPLTSEQGRTSAPDIKDGSGSQVDIVDFAFRLLFRHFLGLDGFPLYFDEFGITFDEEHRTNLNVLLTSMVENGQVPQVFYISHYLQEHSALSNAEICVIDPNNITVPKTYNQHVRLA